MTQNLPLTQNRLSWIDYDKGISIILVCYLHLSYLFQHYYHIDPDSYWILKYSNIFLYGFRMPLFFMVSGVLLGKNLAKKGLPGYIKNRFNTVFYPLLVWGLIRIILQLSLGNLSPKQGSPILFFYLLANPRQIAPLWYLHALFCISVLYALIKVRLKLSTLQNFGLGIVLYLVSDYVTINGVQVGFLADILKYYVFFAVGDLLSDIILSSEAKKFLYSSRLLFLLLLPFVVIQTIVMKYNIAHNNIFYVENAIPLLYLLQGMVGCGLSIAFSFLLQKWDALPALKTIGFHSLYVYSMHYLVIVASGFFFIKILHLNNTLLLVGLCWFAAVSLPILFYKLTSKLNMWWLFTLSKPKDAVLSKLERNTSPAVSESATA